MVDVDLTIPFAPVLVLFLGHVFESARHRLDGRIWKVVDGRTATATDFRGSARRDSHARKE